MTNMNTPLTFPTAQPLYLDAADLARIIRTDLKRAFPGVTFKVHTSKYSMGSSVNVSWTDGPLTDAVDDVIARYKAQGFDGMTDSNTNSGPVRLDDGRLVNIHSFIFAQRRISPDLHARVAAWFDRHFDGGWNGDKEQEIHRASWRAQVVNGCLMVARG